jgi:putative inorganic carbon (hco3(-)) transporter
MPSKRQLEEYEPVVRPRRRAVDYDVMHNNDWRPLRAVPLSGGGMAPAVLPDSASSGRPAGIKLAADSEKTSRRRSPLVWIGKRGHGITYAGLFLFTFLVYFRPYEMFPSLAWLSKSALVVAAITLAVFIPTQLGLENRITAKPREVKLVLGLLLTGILSIPLALEPGRAFFSFIEYTKVIVIFIVMVNVLRTDKRLHGLILMVLLISCLLSAGALNDYARGNLALEGRRIAGLIGGLFSNPNDLALHLVTMIPISVALLLGSRGIARRSFYLSCSLLLAVGLVATFSRGGFLGFVVVMAFLAWKLARRHRLIFGCVALTVVFATVALAPSAYRNRITTTNDDSAIARSDDLKRSILVAARHPLFGVGMDNYIIYSNVNKATHNAYTQVAAEMGVLGFCLYFLFLLTPFKRLRQIERELLASNQKTRRYYLTVGIQASLVGYMVVSFFASVAYQWYVYYIVAYAVSMQRMSDTETAETMNAV